LGFCIHLQTLPECPASFHFGCGAAALGITVGEEQRDATHGNSVTAYDTHVPESGELALRDNRFATAFRNVVDVGKSVGSGAMRLQPRLFIEPLRGSFASLSRIVCHNSYYFELCSGGFSDGFSSFQTGRSVFSFPALKEVFP
jgi:hypothetical protein